MNWRKILTLVGAFGGLLTLIGEVGNVFIPDDEPQCPLLTAYDQEQSEEK